MTTLTITAAEWASVQDGHLWLVREGEVLVSTQRMTPTSNPPGTYDAPPDEFVQACAPCETCGGKREFPAITGARGPMPCPDCRIELVGSCCGADDGYCFRGDCYKVPGSCVLGYGYAIGEPLPIHDRRDRSQYINIDPVGDGSVSVNPSTGIIMLRPRNGALANITDQLAHYGPPETLLGKWALRVQVTP